MMKATTTKKNKGHKSYHFHIQSSNRRREKHLSSIHKNKPTINTTTITSYMDLIHPFTNPTHSLYFLFFILIQTYLLS